MTYLIIGLGNFGLALATRLTNMGHDVFAVDSDMKIVEEYKNRITTTMQVNITDRMSLSALPIDDADEVIVALGNNIGDSVLVVSLLKQAGVKRLVACAMNTIHKTILETLGVDDVIMPETYAAEFWAMSSDAPFIKGVYPVSDSYQLIELEIPQIFEGLTIPEADIETTFSLNLISIKRQSKNRNFLGSASKSFEVINPERDFRFEHSDRILLYGKVKDFENFKRQYKK